MGRMGRGKKNLSDLTSEEQREGMQKAATVASIVLGFLSLSPCSVVCATLSTALSVKVAYFHWEDKEYTEAMLAISPIPIGLGYKTLGKSVNKEFGSFLGITSANTYGLTLMAPPDSRLTNE